MAVREILVPWESQPQEASSPDPERARGLVGLWNFSDKFGARNLVSDQAASFVNTFTSSVDGNGVGVIGTNAASKIDTGLLASSVGVSGNGERTAFAITYLPGIGGLIQLGVPSTGQDWAFRHLSGTTYRVQVWGQTSDDMDLSAYTGIPVCVFMAKRNGVATRVYINGRRVDGGVGPTTLATTDANLLFGTWTNGPTRWNAGIAAGGLFNRGMPDDELELYSAQPWLLFKPKALPVLVALGGGATSITGAATDAADIASGSVTSEWDVSGAVTDGSDTASGSITAEHGIAGAATDGSDTAAGEVTTELDISGAATDSSDTAAGVLVGTSSIAGAAVDGGDTASGVVSNPQAVVDIASGGWDFFLRPIRHRDPPETLPEARKAVKTVVRKAKKLRERADELAAEAAHLARQSEQRERTEATIAELRSQVQQYEQIATQLRIHAELLIEQQREDDDLEILLLAA